MPVVETHNHQDAERGGQLKPDRALVDSAAPTPGRFAMGIIRMPTAVIDAETVTIGVDVYEFDTHTDPGVFTAGRIRVDVASGATVQAQGTLTVAVQPTDGDTFTLDAKVYTLQTTLTNVDGNIQIGASNALTQANIVAAINLTGTPGTDYALAMTIHPTVSAGAFAADDSIMTAKAGGTPGNSIVSTETFTDVGNVFDAATLGTTTAGVDPTVGEASDALIAAINASGTESVTAIDISTTEVLLIGSTTLPAAQTTALAETMAGANNAVDTAAMRDGLAPSGQRQNSGVRVPNAVEVLAGNVHVNLNFDPVAVIVQVRVTATGAAKAWDGDVLLTTGANPRVTINNDGSVDFAATDTIHYLIMGA